MALIDQFDGIYTQTGRYANEFAEIVPIIGMGGFGAVSKVKHNADEKEYAVKHQLVKHRDDFDKKTIELKVWAKLDTEYFVQYRSSWLESLTREEWKKWLKLFYDHWYKYSPQIAVYYRQIYEKYNFRILKIQMDLCEFDLSKAMNKINIHFNVSNNQSLPKMAYYIISELMIEILVSIEYLHSKGLIHRDIKPDNVLIKKGPNAKFIKIADFGLAVTHAQDDEEHTCNVGTEYYMAPEVRSNIPGERRPYTQKADVYSLGVVAMELFNFDTSSERITNLNRITDPVLKGKYARLMAVVENAMKGQDAIEDRPTCGEWLSSKSEWALTINVVIDELNGFDLTRDYDINNDFVKNFQKTKIEFYRKNN